MNSSIKQVEGGEEGLNRQRASARSTYTIFPKVGTNTSKTTDSFKQIINTDDLSFSTNAQGELISWTVNISPDEVSQLRENTDIDRVIEINPSSKSPSTPPTQGMPETHDISKPVEPQEIPPVATQVARAVTSAISDPPLPQPNDIIPGSYAIIPKDGKNTNATNATQQNLQRLLGENLRRPLTLRGVLRYWGADNVTDSQRDEILRDPGVLKVEADRRWGAPA